MSELIRKQIVEVSKLMYEKGMANAYEGNASQIVDGSLLITPSGVSKGFLKEEMLVETDFDGTVISGYKKPSSEIRLHLSAYRNRKDVKAVIHAHSPYATAFAIANKEIKTKGYAEMIMFFDKIPLAAYGTPGTDEVHLNMEKYIMDYDIILLANHGVMTVGKDIYDAFFKLEAAENIARVLFLARQLGGEKDIPNDKIIELEKIRLNIKSQAVK